MEASESRPVYLVAPAGAAGDALQRVLGERPHRRLVSVDALFEPDRTPGLVLFAADVSPADVQRALRRMAADEHRWIPVTVDPDARLAVPVSVAYPLDTRTLVDDYLDPESPHPVLEIRTALDLVAVARHDINNPLTAAMAEVQLLLMDVEEPGELRDGLEAIQAQLRRIRDLVGMLARLRASR
ncbi:MAG: hypothetical protein D6701_05530 [Gemmatimonadetes bacterium]|nr:MAG: hypothetical protein D6701_05530 [Gemmatimonadota bacterium]